MKSIFLTGAVLMAGASIYGFVDYRKSNHSKALNALYKSGQTETKKKILTDEIIIKENETIPAVKENTSGKKQNKVTEKTEPVFTSQIDNTPVDKISEELKEEIKEEPKMIVTEKPELNTKTIKKKKTISSKMFSRAPLKEEYLEKELKPENEKKKKQ